MGAWKTVYVNRVDIIGCADNNNKSTSQGASKNLELSRRQVGVDWAPENGRAHARVGRVFFNAFAQVDGQLGQHVEDHGHDRARAQARPLAIVQNVFGAANKCHALMEYEERMQIVKRPRIGLGNQKNDCAMGATNKHVMLCVRVTGENLFANEQHLRDHGEHIPMNAVGKQKVPQHHELLKRRRGRREAQNA